MEEISDHAKNLTLSEDLEKPLEERVDLFYNFVKVSSATLAVEFPQRLWAEPDWGVAGVNWTRSRCHLSVDGEGLFTELTQT